MNVRRNISSDDHTIFHKIIFPTLFAIFAVIGITVGLFNIHSDLRFFIIFWPAMAVWILWGANRLKWVSIEQNYIYAAGFRKEIRIPLSEVYRVEASYMRNPKEITLRLKTPTEFGRKIVFVPQQRFFESIRGGHPLVDELRSMIEAQSEDYKRSRT